MATVVDQQIPPELLEVLGPQLITRESPRYDTTIVGLNRAVRGSKPRPAPRAHPLALESIARDMVNGWPEAYGPSLASGHYAAILEALNARAFDPAYFSLVTPSEDYRQRSVPTWINDTDHAEDPDDEEAIKPTWCSWSTIAEQWPSEAVGTDPAIPPIGWETTLEPGNWIRDAWLCVRALYGTLSLKAELPHPRVLIGHLTGSIRAEATRNGCRSWFAPAIGLQLSQNLADMRPQPLAGAGTHNALIPVDLELPEPAEPWSATRTLDLVLRLDALARARYAPSMSAFRLTLGALSTHGRYTEYNAWARCTAELQIALYLPSAATP
jgi:hypothetical protein